MTPSPAINDAIAEAVSQGNALVEITTGWSKMQAVAQMRDPMSMALRAKLARDARLRGWAAERTPHNRSDEGFTDDSQKVSLAFPLPSSL